MDTPPQDTPLHVRPASYYWRLVIRRSSEKKQLRRIGKKLLEEITLLKELLLDLGVRTSTRHYLRVELRLAACTDDCREICLLLVRDLEEVKKQVRTHGKIPPRLYPPHEILKEG